MAPIDKMTLEEWMTFEDSHSVSLGSSRAKAPLAWPVNEESTSQSVSRQTPAPPAVAVPKSPKRKLR